MRLSTKTTAEMAAEMPKIARRPDVRGSLNIGCSRDAMEQIRRRALAAQTGVGGLLLGEREGGNVRILNSLELECSHSLGAPFRLTPDEVRLSREVILANGALPVIGWYFSRRQGELDLSRAEIALFEELFPSQWQITLLVLPEAGESARAAFFFRDAAGEMVRVAEQTLQPWPAQTQPFLGREINSGKESTGVWSWILMAIVALAAGAGLFMTQNSVSSKPRPAPAAQIP